MSGDRKSSKAWQFFTDLQNEKAKCNFCQKEFSYKGGGAYNLTRHTKSKHPQAFAAIQECQIEIEASAATHIQLLPSTSTDPTAICIPIASTSTSTSSTTIIPATSEPSIPQSSDIFKFKTAAANTKLTQYFSKPLSAKKTDQLNKTLVKLFVKNYLAFQLIESPELKEFIKELNPGYQLPSRKTLSNALMTNVYLQIKEKVKIELSQAMYVCITTDGWTSKPNENYLAVILISNALKKKCTNFLMMTRPATVTQMTEVLIHEINSRFAGVEENNILAESTILDPRFKKYGFTNEFAYGRACANLKSQAGRIVIDAQHPTIPEPTNSSPPSKRKRSIWDEFDEQVGDILKNINPTAGGIIEVDKYLEEPLLPRSQDPAKWWFSKKEAYPRLYKLFLKRLCIVATSVPSERIFSKAGQVIVDRRNRLSGKKVSQILFLNFNM
ncbi:zinc finger BED domain-containing protein 1-like [Spodoptera litura]|uniref:Zinc finger BED domain-containing protein 1-like n=1 Tax=Spodoptera litura TaxID=69820 RepID=A0A9J7IN25_SPOLT|nr:zinc finger BED domain-containing protein 1-like [Spodoptera litura]XP_022818895.1 zinc finger BED domain-containing protein 1-like [Spodoptera litura]XP_022832159.1 zinc finger BED domain-containing protein 1-like [Spodoptera litura]